jgi:integrase
MGVEIDFSSANGNWVYCPFTHKTERWGPDKFITLGKKAQAILTPFLNACELETEYVFNPSKIVARIDKQRTKPGKKTKKRKRYVADCYNDRTYRQQIERACDKAGIPHWTPNQLRHAKATETRRKHGLEATQSVLGHADLRSTQRYAPRTLDHAFYVQSLNG